MIGFQAIYLGQTEQVNVDTGSIELDLKPHGTASTKVTSNVTSFNFPHHKREDKPQYSLCLGTVVHEVLSDLFGERGTGSTSDLSLTVNIYERVRYDVTGKCPTTGCEFPDEEYKCELRFVIVFVNPRGKRGHGDAHCFNMADGDHKILQDCKQYIEVGYRNGFEEYVASAEALYIKYSDDTLEVAVN